MNDPSPSARPHETWASGNAYEPYVGRWSRLVAREFLDWLAVAPGSRWLDVGCGTGALSQTILHIAAPAQVKGIDRSDEQIAYTQAHVQDQRASFDVGDAQALPDQTALYDAAVSGLVLNFLPQPEQAVCEMARVVRSGGIVAAYVWDYAGKMQLMRHFWNAAVALDPSARDKDEGLRFPLCQPEALRALWTGAGFRRVEVVAIDVDTVFRDFDDYWTPFLSGQAPAPGYCMSLDEAARERLRERLRASLPHATDGTIPLVARAWAVKGRR